MPLTKDIVINLLSIYLDLDQVSKWAGTMTKEKKTTPETAWGRNLSRKEDSKEEQSWGTLDSEILINQIMKRQKHWTHWKYVRSILWIGVLRWTYIIWAYCE